MFPFIAGTEGKANFKESPKACPWHSTFKAPQTKKEEAKNTSRRWKGSEKSRLHSTNKPSCDAFSRIRILSDVWFYIWHWRNGCPWFPTPVWICLSSTSGRALFERGPQQAPWGCFHWHLFFRYVLRPPMVTGFKMAFKTWMK